MRLVNRVAFLALPAGVLFSKYEPCVFDPLCIKGDTIHSLSDDTAIDWYEQQIHDAIDCLGSADFADQLLVAQETGESVPMDFECEGRDGMFEDDEQLFAVWEADDIAALIARLQRCVPA